MLGYAPQARMASAIREEIHDLYAAEAPRSGEADAAASALNVAAPLNVMT
jgi:poly(3-hydroxybutyrate) depolymerase